MSKNKDKEDKEKKEEKEKKEDEKLQMLGLEPVETRHEVRLEGSRLKYTARAGVIPLKDDKGDTRAEVFFTAYELDGFKDRSERPLTFAFNGGPGSSSVWLHMGAIGPKRVVMQPEGWMPAPPYRLEPNESTWLDITDLVFIDPVGTGFSRAAKEDLYKEFLSFEGDIDSVGEFIRKYLSRYDRWASPLFLAGESYGTTRAAGLSEHLFSKGVAFSGIVLISTALDLRPIVFAEGDDLPFPLFVPSYAAAAWYHGKLEEDLQKLDLPDLLAEVRSWAEGELTTALMKGDRIEEQESSEVARKLARYTGLDPEYVTGSNLRVHMRRFRKELLRQEKRSIGRFDARFKGIEPLTVTESPEFDPSSTAITPPYTSMFNDYVRRELKVYTDMEYSVMMDLELRKKWEWEKGKLPSTGEKLRIAMAVNPFMKVLVGQGYYDLATPHMATEYMINHMNVDPELLGNVSIRYYHGGHMFYLDKSALGEFKADVESFINQMGTGE
jgi:carboxypeptidase C (cathepsin A)